MTFSPSSLFPILSRVAPQTLRRAQQVWALLEAFGEMAQSERSAAGALVARLSLLVLNLVLFSLGVTLLVMSTQKSHYTDIMKTVYAEGGVTVEVFEQPDAALTLAGFFITFVSLQVRFIRRTRPHRGSPPFQNIPRWSAPSPPKSDTDLPPSPPVPAGHPRRVHGIEADHTVLPRHVHVHHHRHHLLRRDDDRVQR